MYGSVADSLRVTFLEVVPADDASRDRGVIAWLSFVVGDGLLVDGVAFRMTAQGRPEFTWPGRYDGVGILRHTVRPLTDGVREDIEAQLLRQIGPHLRAGGAA